jgi:hypothetical protein
MLTCWDRGSYKVLPDHRVLWRRFRRRNPYTDCMFPMKFFEYRGGPARCRVALPALAEFSSACELVDTRRVRRDRSST